MAKVWVDQCDSVFVSIINARLLGEVKEKEAAEVKWRLLQVVDRLLQMRLMAPKAGLDAATVEVLKNLHCEMMALSKGELLSEYWEDPLERIETDAALRREKAFLDKKNPDQKAALRWMGDQRGEIWRFVYEARVIIAHYDLPEWQLGARVALQRVMRTIELKLSF